MQKRDRKSYRLLKTTTFSLTLLIAAILIFSSVVPAAIHNGTPTGMKIKKSVPNSASQSKMRIDASLAHNYNTPNTPTNPTSAPDGVPILTEGFEGTWLPTGWSVIQTNPGPGSGSIPPYWSQTSYDYHSGSYAAGLWWDYAHQDEWLITPEVTLTGSTTGNYYVTFWTYGWEGSIYDDHYYVKISTDGGTTWTALFDLSDLTGNDWNDWEYPYTVNLNAYAGQDVKLAWHAIDCNDPGNPNYPGLWYIWIIDDVEIGYFDVPDHDVGTVSIDSPVSGPAGVIAPKVTVENYGLNAETFNLNVKIGTYLSPNQIYSQSWEVLNPWPPTNWMIYSNDAYATTWIKATDYFHSGTKSAKCQYQTLFDDWLVTKSSVVPGGGGSFSLWLRGYSTYAEPYKIYYSTTGNTIADFLAGTLLDSGTIPGATWTLKTYDMTSQAGNAVWYAVRYQGTTSQWYLWADDFTFPDGTTEGFEGYDIPDWNTVKVSGTSTYNDWTVVATSTSPTASPHDGAKFMKYYGYLAPAGQSNRLYMDTTSLDLAATSLDVIQMKLWMFHDTVAGAAKLEIQASLDKITWTTLATINRNDGSPLGWKEHTIDFSAYATQSTVYIGFLATSDYNANIYIDDFKMFASGVTWNEYNNNTLVSLNVGETKQITCPNWTPLAWHNQQNVTITYPIKAETQLVGDGDSSNNVKQKDFALYFPFFYDVQSVAITSPTTSGSAQQTYTVKSSIKNVGQYPANTFWVNAKITEIAYTTLLNEDFEGSWGPMGNNPPAGWTITTNEPTPVTWDNNNWHKSTYTGQSSTARIYWSPVRTQDDSLITPTLNCVGLSNVQLQFWSYFYYYSASSYGYVDGSINGGSTWFNIDTYHSTQTAGVKTYDISSWAAGQANVKIRFRYVDYDGLYWYVDNVKVFSVSYTQDYNDYAPVSTVLNPGETRELTYPTQWIPSHFTTGISGSYDYNIVATTLYLGDGNPINNVTSQTITLTYTHDVAVKSITSPYNRGAGTWLKYTNEVDANNLGSTTGQMICAIRLTPTELAGHSGEKLTKVKFYHYDDGAGYTHDGTVKIYDQGTTTAPGSILATQAFTGASGQQWIEIPIATPPTIDATKDIWVGVDIPHSTSPQHHPQGLSDGGVVGKSFWFSSDGGTTWYDLTSSYAYDNMIEAYVELVQGPPTPSVYYKTGSTVPVSAIVNNLGTWVESGLTAYAEMWDYIVNPNGSVNWWSNVSDISLNPLGGEQSVNFGNYQFVSEGVYNLLINLPLVGLYPDDVPTNNYKSIGIGADDTPPTSSHTLTPESPDGENEWYISDVTVTITSSDPESNSVTSGMKEIQYKIDSGSWQTKPGNSATFKVTTDGEHTVQYKGVDNVGNEETPKSVSFKIDKTKPDMTMSYEATGNAIQGWEITVTVDATDAASDMDKVEFYFNGFLQETVTGLGPLYTWTYPYTPLPSVDIMGIAYDQAGNNRFEIIHNPENQNQQSQQQQQSQIHKIITKQPLVK